MSNDYEWRCFFFFQAEDGIRDSPVTGVQTCALPILPTKTAEFHQVENNYGFKSIDVKNGKILNTLKFIQIGRASCRERV